MAKWFLFLFLFQNIVQSSGNCIEKPQDKSCADFLLPSVENDIASLCSDMPNMPGCTIQNICKSNKKHSNEKYCTPISVLTDICQFDMPKMDGCKNYTSMCAKGSVVLECQAPAPDIPSTMKLSNLVTDICNSMPMEDCKKCKISGPNTMLDCDVLSVYSDLCFAMPDMSQCEQWKKFCRDPLFTDWPVCSKDSNGHAAPIMRMYFHTGIEDYILFKQWVPRSNVAYFFSFIAIVIAGIFWEGLKPFSKFIEKYGSKKDNDTDLQPLLDINYSPTLIPLRFFKRVTCAFLCTLTFGLGYMLMLVAMTFNVGLFIAVLLGVFIGKILFCEMCKSNEEFGCH